MRYYILEDAKSINLLGEEDAPDGWIFCISVIDNEDNDGYKVILNRAPDFCPKTGLEVLRKIRQNPPPILGLSREIITSNVMNNLECLILMPTSTKIFDINYSS